MSASERHKSQPGTPHSKVSIGESQANKRSFFPLIPLPIEHDFTSIAPLNRERLKRMIHLVLYLADQSIKKPIQRDHVAVLNHSNQDCGDSYLNGRVAPMAMISATSLN
jgi:hypothetical protein